MNLGYFVPEFPGQTHAFFWREARELTRRGVNVEFVSTRRPKAGRAQHVWADEATDRTVYLTDHMSKAVWKPKATWELIKRQGRETEAPSISKAAMIAAAGSALAEISQQRQWDHIHVHSCAAAADVARVAGWVSGTPYSLTLHSPIHQFGPRQRTKWADAAFGIAVTKVLKKSAIDMLASLDDWPSESGPTQVEVAPMGVDLETFTRVGGYQPWAAGQGEPLRLVTCGRLNPCKGHDDAIRVVRQLREDGLPAELTIIGGSDGRHSQYPTMLRDLAESLGVAANVHFTGSIGEEAVARELAGSHCFILASKNEAIGVATMEAMAMGLPVVVTNCPGVGELVHNRDVGRLVDVEDPAAMASAVFDYATKPNEALAVSLAGRKLIEERFHSGVSAELLCQLLGERTEVVTEEADAPLINADQFSAV